MNDEKMQTLGERLIDMGRQFLELASRPELDQDDRYIPIAKVAKQLGCSGNTVRSYIRKGYFTGYHLSERCTVVLKSEFEAWVEGRRIAPILDASPEEPPAVDFSQSASKGRYKSPALKLRQA